MSDKEKESKFINLKALTIKEKAAEKEATWNKKCKDKKERQKRIDTNKAKIDKESKKTKKSKISKIIKIRNIKIW